MGSRIEWKKYHKKMSKTKLQRQKAGLSKGMPILKKINNPKTRQEDKNGK